MVNKSPSQTLEAFLKQETTVIFMELVEIVDRESPWLRQDSPEDEPRSLDIRLCIDPDGDTYDWIFRTGDASFDQRHSIYCAASSIQADTEPITLWRELRNQILDCEVVS